MRKVKLKYQHVRPAPTLHINTVYLVYFHFLTGLLGPVIHNSTTYRVTHTQYLFVVVYIERIHTFTNSWSQKYLQRAGQVEPRGVYILNQDDDVF